jgi:hypothetical protein
VRTLGGDSFAVERQLLLSSRVQKGVQEVSERARYRRKDGVPRAQQVLEDVALSIHHDHAEKRLIGWVDVEHRYKVFEEARGAMRGREDGGIPAFRQSLVELAAAAIQTAEDYRRPGWDSAGLGDGQKAEIRRQVPQLDEIVA